jgi:hypothetical protein
LHVNAIPANEYSIDYERIASRIKTINVWTMDVVGVDGCRGGWFAVALGSNRNWAIDVYKTMEIVYPPARVV